MAIQNMFNEAKEALDLILAKKNTPTENPDIVNIVLAGKTGVGKSTLINAVFGEDFAKTGVGAPITPDFSMYEKDGMPLRVYDVKGFELDTKVQKKISSEMKKLIKASLRTEDKNDDIHLMWYCVSSEGSRFDQFEIDFINEFAKLIDIVIVITKSLDQDATRKLMLYIEETKNRGALSVKAIVPVLASDKLIDGLGVKEKFGLKELTDLSYELLPDVQKRAFAASQQVSRDLRKRAAQTAIAFASVAAAATGVIPIPIADAAVLVPIQLTMLKGIANSYGIKFTENDFSKVIAVIAPAVTTYVGKAAVISLLKLVPGLNVATAVVSGAVAAAITVALGTAFQKALEYQVDKIDFNDVLPEEFIQIMKETFDATLKDCYVKKTEA